MADQESLRFIGFAFGLITAAVTLVAVLVVATGDRPPELPSSSARLATSTG